MYIYIYIYVHTCTHLCVYIYIYVYIHVYMYTHIQIHILVYMGNQRGILKCAIEPYANCLLRSQQPFKHLGLQTHLGVRST